MLLVVEMEEYYSVWQAVLDSEQLLAELEKNDFEGLLVYGDDKQPLVLDKDYVIDTTYDMNRRKKDVQMYSKNDKVGQASVVIRGLGKYAGTRVVYYKVIPRPLIPEEATPEGDQAAAK